MTNRSDQDVLAEWSAATSVKPASTRRRRPQPPVASSDEIPTQSDMNLLAQVLAELADLHAKVETLTHRVDAAEAAQLAPRSTKSTPATKAPRRSR